jgi:hypothetical protein
MNPKSAPGRQRSAFHPLRTSGQIDAAPGRTSAFARRRGGLERPPWARTGHWRDQPALSPLRQNRTPARADSGRHRRRTAAAWCTQPLPNAAHTWWDGKDPGWRCSWSGSRFTIGGLCRALADGIPFADLRTSADRFVRSPEAPGIAAHAAIVLGNRVATPEL